MSPLTPAGLKDLKAKEIEALVVGTTRHKLTVGDLFKVKGKDAASLRFAGTDARCDKIGGGLTEGKIVVDGDVGAYLGAGMKGGKIEVKGNAGVLAAATMTGGAIAINGDAGERMRRGLVIVYGDAGDYAGGRMVAGTILIKHRVGRFAGYGLRRGSLILLNEPKELPPTFGDCGVMEFDYLKVLEHWLRESGKTISLSGRARRLMGDMSVLGKGEVLIVV